MQTTAIFLLFIFGAVAVVAEKKLEEENGEANKYFLGFKKQVNTLLNGTEKKFKRMEKLVHSRKTNLQDSLTKKLEISEGRLKEQHEYEIKKAKKEGKSEVEIQGCLDRNTVNFRAEMKDDFESTFSCFAEATQEAQRNIKEAEEDFAQSCNASVSYGENLAKYIDSCDSSTDDECSIKGMLLFQEEIDMMIDAGDYYLDFSEEAVERQNREMDDCYDEFMENLDDNEDFYGTKIKECLST